MIPVVICFIDTESSELGLIWLISMQKYDQN